MLFRSAYGHGLSDKPEIVALSQVDILDDETKAQKIKELEKASGQSVIAFSAVSHQGLDNTLRAVAKIIEASRSGEQDDVKED